MARLGGYLIGTGNFTTIERDTVQCVHCGMHYIVQPGSGKQRGFCLKCMGATCGQAQCHTCVTIAQRLDMHEAFEREWQKECDRIAEKWSERLLRTITTTITTLTQRHRYHTFMHNLWGGK